MKVIKRYISRNWLLIVTGLILMKVCIKIAYVERGYIAYGGEWLILPVLLMLAEVIRNVCDAVRYLLGKEDEL